MSPTLNRDQSRVSSTRSSAPSTSNEKRSTWPTRSRPSQSPSGAQGTGIVAFGPLLGMRKRRRWCASICERMPEVTLARFVKFAVVCVGHTAMPRLSECGRFLSSWAKRGGWPSASTPRRPKQRQAPACSSHGRRCWRRARGRCRRAPALPCRLRRMRRKRIVPRPATSCSRAWAGPRAGSRATGTYGGSSGLCSARGRWPGRRGAATRAPLLSQSPRAARASRGRRRDVRRREAPLADARHAAPVGELHTAPLCTAGWLIRARRAGGTMVTQNWPNYANNCGP